MGLLDEARRLAVGLGDVQFRQLLTPRMLPAIYLLGVVLAAMLTLYLIAHGFRDGWLSGLAWLLLLGPAVFLALVGALRIGLPVNQTVLTPVTAAIPLRIVPKAEQVRLTIVELFVALRPSTMLSVSLAADTEGPERADNPYCPLDHGRGASP